MVGSDAYSCAGGAAGETAQGRPASLGTLIPWLRREGKPAAEACSEAGRIDVRCAQVASGESQPSERVA